MVDRHSASVAQLEADAAALKAAIDARTAKTKATLNAELQARLKALDGQLDGLSVSASQLSAGVALCARSRVVDDAPTLLASLNRMLTLQVDYHGPPVSVVCEAVTNTDAVLRCIEAEFVTPRLAVDGDRSTVHGAWRVGEYHRPNVIVLTCRDGSGAEVDTLTPDDVTLWVTECDESAPDVSGAGGIHVDHVTYNGAGVFEIAYTVTNQHIAAFVLHVSVAGNTSVAHSPWRIEMVNLVYCSYARLSNQDVMLVCTVLVYTDITAVD